MITVVATFTYVWPTDAPEDFVFCPSCCDCKGGKFCVLFIVLLLLLYHADDITGSSTVVEEFYNNQSWRNNIL